MGKQFTNSHAAFVGITMEPMAVTFLNENALCAKKADLACHMSK